LISLNVTEVTFKELKSGLHWGQMQVTKEKERVKRAMLLPVMAYALLLRLYGRDLKPDQGFTIFQLTRPGKNSLTVLKPNGAKNSIN
jgi:hypothetical protein